MTRWRKKMPATQLPHPPSIVPSPRRIRLGRSDFAQGPYVVTEPDVELVLTEDVVLNFGEPPPPKESPHHLGFFGGIVIGAPRVVIDLNRKSLSMHPMFRERQRFFALISLDVTPFPVGKAKFTTEPKSPTDIVIKNGTLGLTSHFCVHGNTLREGRLLLSDLRMEDFEVGAVSVSGASDVMVRRCSIGSAVPPTMTSDMNMFRDLADVVEQRGSKEEAHYLRQLALQHQRILKSSDAIVRALVFMPTFNVNGVPDTFERRIRRIAVVDCTFEDLRAEPVEVVGASLKKHDTEALRDVRGNLIAYDDVVAGARLSTLQAAFNPDLPRGARGKLMGGPSSSFHPVRGQDRRGHALQGKSSLFLRIDGCDDVTLRNLTGAHVRSYGPESAAVGFMLNGCKRIVMHHVRVGGVEVHDVASNPLSDERPQSGVLLRRCQDVVVDSYVYESKAACGFASRFTSNAQLRRCEMNAPSTFLKCKHVAME